MIFNRDDDFMFQRIDIIKYEIYVLLIGNNIMDIFM